MGEQMTEQFDKKVERKSWLRDVLSPLLVEIAISAVITDPAVAGEAYKVLHKPDALLDE